MHNTLSHPKYRPDIDGLRAVAVLSVVAFHAAPSRFAGGFVGVDIFFVISGYLISTIIFENLARGTFSFREFYSRRIKRIFPSLIVVLCAVGAFGWYVLFTDEFAQLGKHISAGAGFVSNLALWSEAGYFDASAERKPLLHLWSLGIEEQFYIAWPLLAWLAWRKQFGLSLVTSFLLLGSFVLNVSSIQSDPVGTFYSPLTRIWELLAGSLVAWHVGQRRNLSGSGLALARRANVLSFSGMSILAIAFILLHTHRAFPGWWALLPVIGSALVIVAGPSAWFNRTLLSRSVMVWFGLISYPLYLWHWPLLSFIEILDLRSWDREARFGAVILAIVLAWLTYRFVERPLRHGKGDGQKVWLLSGGMVLVLAAGIAISTELVSPRNDSPTLGKLVRARSDWEFPPARFRPYPSEHGPAVALSGSAPGVVVMLGDSIAQQYAPRVDQLAIDARESLRSVIFATEGGCPPIPGVLRDDRPQCSDTLKTLIDIAMNEQVDSVVVAACWYCYFVYAAREDSNDHYYMLKNGKRVYFKHGEAFDSAFESLEALLRTLARDKAVALVLSTPSGPTVNPNRMYVGTRLGGAKLRETGTFTGEEFLVEFSGIRERLIEVARRAGVRVIDPVEYLCDSGTCQVSSSEGDPIFKDSVHLRSSFVRNNVYYLDEIFMAMAD